MSTSSARTTPRRKPGVVARLLVNLRRPFVTQWSMLRFDEVSAESLISYHGAVEIRQSHAGYCLQTCVKGELDAARTTALRRFADYLVRRDRSGTPHRAAGPLVQRQEAPGRWLVSVALPDQADGFVPMTPHHGKIRIRPMQPELHAVLCMYGRPTPQAMTRSDAVIRAALADTMWVPSGGPAIRLLRAPTVLPLPRRYEIALPIERRHYYAASQREAHNDFNSCSASRQHATHPGLSLHAVAC